MKKIIFLAISCALYAATCLATGLPSPEAGNESVSISTSDGYLIDLRPVGGGGGTDVPRSPALIPVQARLFGTYIIINFIVDLGETGVTLVNEDTGETVYDTLPGNGPALLTFSGDSGSYILTFTLESGVEFVGNFSL